MARTGAETGVLGSTLSDMIASTANMGWSLDGLSSGPHTKYTRIVPAVVWLAPNLDEAAAK